MPTFFCLNTNFLFDCLTTTLFVDQTMNIARVCQGINFLWLRSSFFCVRSNCYTSCACYFSVHQKQKNPFFPFNNGIKFGVLLCVRRNIFSACINSKENVKKSRHILNHFSIWIIRVVHCRHGRTENSSFSSLFRSFLFRFLYVLLLFGSVVTSFGAVTNKIEVFKNSTFHERTQLILRQSYGISYARLDCWKPEHNKSTISTYAVDFVDFYLCFCSLLFNKDIFDNFDCRSSGQRKAD